ncbi:hypothetical protein BDP55DRAFT_727549 [Colletotrichum godetiae]|uniref:Uncharacterized protein n=1 Tax=Colletotrichum godetiae TaxID=1209918 RepID=A0AAJ0AP09_9PEZI|nr:uncharacterized protein BDP55DRAFT_727549 [Colletotrichum godetiae]KAK1676739.1 hypothetical protein BDP55DRAFT_727549 [Colletotrichum godetiae]
MCQKVFYTYACQHVECVTYDCIKSRGSTRNGCMHREPSEHTSLKDQICHDCNEVIRITRQNRHGARVMGEWEQRIHHYNNVMEGAQIILDHQQASQAQQRQQGQQTQSRPDQQSISPSGKTIRPLESNKMGNMRREENIPVAPSRLYQINVARDTWFAVQRGQNAL